VIVTVWPTLMPAPTESQASPFPRVDTVRDVVGHAPTEAGDLTVFDDDLCEIRHRA
jgi:hypothetical protein